MTNAPSRALRPPIFYLIVALIFLSDQVSKIWVQRSLILNGPSRPVFGNAFLLTLTQNTGGAWSLMPRGNNLFIVFAILAAVALVVAYHNMKTIDLFVGAAFALALGGALGNLLDRLRYGYVVDFFEARIIHFPIFNVADSAITVGILLLLVHFFRAAREEPTAQPLPLGETSATGVTTAATYRAEDAGSPRS